SFPLSFQGPVTRFETLQPRLQRRFRDPLHHGIQGRHDLRAGRECASGGFFGLTEQDRKSTRLNSSHVSISYAVFCLKKKKYKVSSSSQVLQYIWYLGPTVSILRSIYFS